MWSHFRKYLLFGGISQNEYQNIKAIIRKSNLKIWKVISILLEVLFMSLFLCAIIITYANISNNIIEGFKPFVIPLGILSGYMIVFIIVNFLALSPESKIFLPSIYVTNGIILACLGSIAFIKSDMIQTCLPFLLAMMALPFFNIDRPVRVCSFLLFFGLVFVILCIALRDINSILLGVVFTVVSVFVAFVFSLDRILHSKEIHKNIVTRNIDELTGLKNADAYDKDVLKIKITEKNASLLRFAVATFDVVGLKELNSEFGPEAGDRAVLNAASLLKSTFKTSQVYRTGGDGFVVILKGADYANRVALIKKIEDSIKKSSSLERDDSHYLLLAYGMNAYSPKKDKDYFSVYQKASMLMYDNKREMKK